MPTQGRDLLELLDLQAWGQRLLQLLDLLLVGDLQSVQEAGTTDLELHVVSILLYLDALGILPLGIQEKILDFLDLTRHPSTSLVEVNQAV